LRNLIRMELGKRFAKRVESGRPRLEHDDDFSFVGHFSLPAIERSRAWKQRSARDESSVEKDADELHRFFVGSARGEHHDGIGMRHGTQYSALFRDGPTDSFPRLWQKI